MRKFGSCLFAAALLAALPTRAAPVWHQLAAPEFTVVSQLSEANTRAWADEFSQFIEALGGIVPMDLRALPPLTVVLFAAPEEFAPYRPLGPDGKPIDIAGFFSRHRSWAIIGLASRANDAATRHIIFHEGVHWGMSQIASNYPLWLNEGLAEVFSTFRVEDGQARWGDPIWGHIALLQKETPLPLQTLVSITSDNPLYYKAHSIGIYYAESWAFVHYLLFGQRAGARASLSYYLESLRRGVDPTRAFQDAFGTSFSGMDDALQDYVNTGSYGVSIQRFPSAADARAEFRPAPPLLVAITLQKLALSSGRRVPIQTGSAGPKLR